MPVVILVADGARPDALDARMRGGELPALAALRDEGAMHTITTCAPSVTGPAYTPFLLGRYPAPVGLPGLRWLDRTRIAARLPGHSRSYVGFEMQRINDDLEESAATIFELVPGSVGALSVITRGLLRSNRIGYGAVAAVRAGITHFRGDVSGWLDLDRRVARKVAERVATESPPFIYAAFTGVDKTSHAQGQRAPIVSEALQIVDNLVAELRERLQASDRWHDTHLWVVSDHGHVDLREHEDLAGVVSEWGYAVRAHPWAYTPRGELGVMVSGNAMAHLYLDLAARSRQWWPAFAKKFEPFVEQLLARESVDLLLLPLSPSRTEVRALSRGTAVVESSNGRYSYRPCTGDPLGLGELTAISADEAYDATASTDYPDSLVQIAALCAAPRSGDVIISATRDWDFRANHEPIPHVSSHGALHRDHMLVPLLMNRPARSVPRRTVDVFPSALAALGIAVPDVVDGTSFL